ncbi:methyltransferase family protein [Hirschia baltica]|uniref:Isoprenylcysteine carboxyl methyltransferase n=1 Tax=Hirschia baltica (strain ATCC 49814 / DSM 5838 / IFAM 1418) TaxID=582402 RepID=C6XPD1_HIRBI|nr:isoprenylcysteine carboxylmethyltransferase family protein [Hirschia baltica]ACT58417.1 conserved hypothetical protein [Hirschia baltica ATCC 49814]
MKLKIPPIIQFLFFSIAGLVSSILLPTNQVSWLIFSYLGWVLIGIGALILAGAVLAFINAKTSVNPVKPDQAKALVMSGLYRFSRNPMYLGMALILFGEALVLGNFFVLLAPILFVICITYMQIIPEEKVLEMKFGQEYLHYKKSIPRFILFV